jgi:hypothetical protein
MSCVNADGDEINVMKGVAIPICRDTFVKYLKAGEWKKLRIRLGYSRSFSITNDWHVKYYKSTYEGVGCVYLVHSGIEYICLEK